MKHWDIWDTRMNVRAGAGYPSLALALRSVRLMNAHGREPGRYAVREATEPKTWAGAVLTAGPL
jgi:hypothetical protein